MVPYLLYVAGVAAFSFFGVGCASQKALTPREPRAPKMPQEPPQPSGPQFPKHALAWESNYTEGNGYELIRRSIARDFNNNQGQPILSEGYSIFHEPLSIDGQGEFLNFLIAHPERAEVAQKFIDRMAGFDGHPEDLSLYDYLFSSFYLYTLQWHDPWGAENFLEEKTFPYSTAEHIKVIGLPLLDPTTETKVSAQSRDLLQSLSYYLNSPAADHSQKKLQGLVDFYLKGREPAEFSWYFQVRYGNFLKLTPEQRSPVFEKAVADQWPTPETIETLSPYLQRSDLTLWMRACFKKDPMAAFALFEGVTLEKNFSLTSGYDHTTVDYSNEVELFPNLPQDTPYEKRQAAIDGFLGDPILVQEKKHYYGAVKTTVKKYLWPGDTEVFSIESGKPGPTTLVFSPHYHEPNPRKYFHWLKDLPLKTGRVIFIPEANRAMNKLRSDTNAMNRIFNRSLLSQRIDHVIVRRVEYLMGLVDGIIGDHDAWGGPFYISDFLEVEDRPDLKTQPSPWLQKEVLKIKEIKLDEEKPEENPGKEPPTPKLLTENQVQWQIADYSRKKMRKLAGRDFRFTPETVRNEQSRSVKTTTGYAQYRLGKPAMTFEGNKREEHGQLHAMALYTLLLGFGHNIHRFFEKKLKDPLPPMEPELYRGNHVTLTNLPD